MQQVDAVGMEADHQTGAVDFDDGDTVAWSQAEAAQQAQAAGLARSAGQAEAAHKPSRRQDHADDQYQYCDDTDQCGLGHDDWAWSAPVVEAAETFGRCDNVSQTNTVAVFDDDDFALGDQKSVDEDVHGFTCQAIQFDY